MPTAIQNYLDSLTHKLLHQQGKVVPINAADIIAGTMGANVGNGDYTFPANLQINNTLKFKDLLNSGTRTILAYNNRFEIGGSASVWIRGSGSKLFCDDGIELAHPSSTPYIDFHRSTDPTEATDYNMRIINDAANVLSVYGGRFVIDCTPVDNLTVQGSGATIRLAARDASPGTFLALYNNAGYWRFWDNIGGTDRLTIDRSNGNLRAGTNAMIGMDPTYGGTFAWFSHQSRYAANQYCLLQGGGGESYLNAGPANVVYVRQNNNDIAQFVGTSGDFSRLNLFTGSDAGAWDQRCLRLHAPSRPGIAFYHTGNGAVDQLCDQGPRIDCLDWSGTAGFPSGASSFVTISREATKIKGTIKNLDKSHEHTRLQKLRPVRFKRPHVTTHVTCKGRGCEECSRNGVPGQINKPFIDKNEDTDFIGFIAEEVAEHFPELINWEPSVKDDWDSEPRPGGIDLGALTAHLTVVLQDIVSRVEVLEKK